ncbi:hypothetical protein GCM10009020_17400 [Natronoarchaeum mannanilyticum]|uniref:Sulfatase n=1 Tax=Natronoarchaeum mannanilyticum TaxID=926360 RepID=A0AAV3T9S0_9EURY
MLSRVVGPLTRLIYGSGGEDVMSRDWDNLFIFDACRSDMFEEVVGVDQFDSYETIRSKGGNSPEWIRNNFNGKTYNDTIYVVANPWTHVLEQDIFFKVIDVFEEKEMVQSCSSIDFEKWDDVGTVPASVMNDVTRKIHDTHPDKRLIVHYFQPHDPVIGRGDGEIEIDEELEPRTNLVTGRVSPGEIWDGYSRNLQYVYHYAEKLMDDLDGKTVISADHGELLGEILWPIPVRGYAHPEGVYHPNLTTVPWAEIDGERREIAAGQGNHDRISKNKERLRDLGYLGD